jgi:phage gpG-like protein
VSDDDEKTDMDFAGLDRLVFTFKKVPTVKIGILGDGAAREPGEDGKKALTNAQIGAIHEFGSAKASIPQRSFLRVPLIDNLDKRLKSSGIITKQTIAKALKAGTLRPIMAKVGVIAEGIVLEAFDTNGFGKWAPLKPRTLAAKKNQQTLVETQQLRNSITHEVGADGEDKEE